MQRKNSGVQDWWSVSAQCEMHRWHEYGNHPRERRMQEPAARELRRPEIHRRRQRVLPLAFHGIDVIYERVHPRIHTAGAAAALNLFLLLRVALADLFGLCDR